MLIGKNLPITMGPSISNKLADSIHKRKKDTPLIEAYDIQKGLGDSFTEKHIQSII